MSKPLQKQVERRRFDRFREVSGLLNAGRVIEAEEPDFLVSDERVVGVELTELFWKGTEGVVPHQAIEALRARIAEVAWSKYDAKGLPPVHVSIHFDPGYVPTKKDVQRLSDAISGWAAARVPEEGSSFSEDYDWENRAYFPEEVSCLSMWRFAGFSDSFFSSPGAAFIPAMAASDIERALELKEPKVRAYRKKCREAWLLINCDGGRISNVFKLDDNILERSYESSFDRVFLFRHITEKIHEIQLRHTGA